MKRIKKYAKFFLIFLLLFSLFLVIPSRLSNLVKSEFWAFGLRYHQSFPPSLEVSRYFSQQLVQLDSSAIPALNRLIKQSDQEIQANAILVVFRLKTKATVTLPSLKRIFSSPHSNDFLRSSALAAIGKIEKTQNLYPFIVKGFMDVSESVRYEANKLSLRLKEHARKKLTKVLLRALKKYPCRGERQALILAFKQIRPEFKAIYSQLSQWLGSKQSCIQAAAIDVLGELSPPTPHVISHLLQMLGKTSHDVRISAIRALGKLAPQKTNVILSLSQLLTVKEFSKDGIPSLFISIINALKKSGSSIQIAVPYINKALQIKGLEYHAHLVDLLEHSQVRIKNAIPGLLYTLQGKHASGMYARMQAAKVLGSKKALPLSTLESLIMSKNPKLRIIAAYGFRFHSLALPLLQRTLRDDDIHVRVEAIKSLCFYLPNTLGEIVNNIKKLNSYYKSGLVDWMIHSKDLRDKQKIILSKRFKMSEGAMISGESH